MVTDFCIIYDTENLSHKDLYYLQKITQSQL
jgi:hypothetical protein